MEHAGFLNVPHQNGKSLNIISWNINGARTKLDKKEVNDFLICYDIICLNEVKPSVMLLFLDISLIGVKQ